MKREFVEISKIKDFKDHPFKVVDDERMERLVESVKENGIITPVVVRQVGDDYEMISGHRRKRAAEIVGLKEIPCVVKELNDDEATILMVQSNIQREQLLPSEKAFAYKMELEALKHQGKRTDGTSNPMGWKLESANKVGQEVGESLTNVRRYIRLTYLIPELLAKVDSRKIGFRPAVEISYLQKESQQNLLNLLQSNSKYKITLAVAKELKELEKQNNRALTESEIKAEFEKAEPKKEKIGDIFEMNVTKPAFTRTIAIKCESRRPVDPGGWLDNTFKQVKELGWEMSDLLLSLFDYINNEHKIPVGLVFPRTVEEKKEEVKVEKPKLLTLNKPIYELDLTECRDCLDEIKRKRELNNDKMLFWVEEHKIAERVNDLQRDNMSMCSGDEDYWA